MASENTHLESSVKHTKLVSFEWQNDNEVRTLEAFDLATGDSKAGVLLVGTMVAMPKSDGFYLTHMLRRDEVSKLTVALMRWLAQNG